MEEQPNNNQAEQHFLKNIERAMIVSIGAKRQGKSFLLQKVLIYAINNNIFDEYHLVIPNVKQERDNKWSFLVDLPNVFIYDKYHSLISERMYKLYKKKHIFFCVDDASGEFMGTPDESFIKLCTRNEHAKWCAIWLNIHSCRKVLSPIIRQQITNIFIYKLSNMKLLKDIYEEYFEMRYPVWKEFHALYTERVLDQEHNAIMHSLDGHNEVEGIINWDLLKLEPNQQTETKPIKQTTQQPQTQRRESFLASLIRKRL